MNYQDVQKALNAIDESELSGTSKQYYMQLKRCRESLKNHRFGVSSFNKKALERLNARLKYSKKQNDSQSRD